MKKALIVGSLNVDLTAKVDTLPKLGETILSFESYKSFGGKGANQAVVISKLGLKTKMIGMVGNDENGELLINNLSYNNVESSVIKGDFPTGNAIITVDKKGNNHIVVIPGANYHLTKKEIDYKINDIANTDIVILQNEIPLETTEYVLRKSKEFNKLTIFNPAPATKLDKEIYNYIDYLIVNETEFEFIFDINVNDTEIKNKVLTLKKKNNIKNLLITLGDKGSIIFTEDGDVKTFESYNVKAVDTTAAGDSFIGAFAYKIVNGYKIDEAMKYATIVSAIVVTKYGAQESIPSENEIKEFIQKNKKMEVKL